jgi:hypothetical protein
MKERNEKEVGNMGHFISSIFDGDATKSRLYVIESLGDSE